jgi:hypothetical protein
VNRVFPLLGGHCQHRSTPSLPNLPSLFALAPRGADPSVLLYRVGSKQPTARLVLPAPLAESCITALAVSREGRRVLAVSTLPTNALAVWDVTTGEALAGVAGVPLPAGVLFTDASFCPVSGACAAWVSLPR